MSRDIYPSLAGASAAWSHLEVVANNISNATTTGFKAQRMRFDNAMVNEGVLGNGYVQAEAGVQDFSDGALIHDEVSTHLALQGRGFFAVESGGQTLLMRAGMFSLSSEGQLVTPDGERVLGESGPIQLLPGQRMTVTASGVVMVDGEELDKLQILDADELTPIGGTRWRAEGPSRRGTAQVVQGALEGSNADPMRGMTELIQTSRYFEMYQKAMQTSDELDRTNIDIARKA